MGLQNKRKIDKIQGNRVARNLKELAGIAARRVSGSGSKWYALGDVTSSLFLFENKDAEKPVKQATIYLNVLEKLKHEAFLEGKIPVYVRGFGNGKDLVIMDDVDWYGLVDRMVTAEKRVGELEEKLKTLTFQTEGGEGHV